MTNTIQTIKPSINHFHVTPAGIELSQFEQLQSEKGKLAIYQALCFGGVQSLMARTVNYVKIKSVIDRMKAEGRTAEVINLEASNRYLTAKEQAEAAAIRLSVIHAHAESLFTIVLDFTPTMQRGSSTSDLEMKASFAGVELDYVKAIEAKNALKKFKETENASSLAEALFYSADVENTSTEYNADGDEMCFSTPIKVFIRPDIMQKALIRSRDYLLTWSTPDWAEMGLIKADLESLEKAADKYEAMQDNGNENNIDGDAQPAEAVDGTNHFKQVTLEQARKESQRA